MLNVDIVAPDRTVFSGEAESVQAPGTEGSFEVLTDHAPMIAALDIGILRILPGGQAERIAFATSGGFLEVLNNVVTVVAETAEPADEIDVERARRAEERAQELFDRALSQEGDDVDRERAEAARERARNRLRLAMGEVGA